MNIAAVNLKTINNICFWVFSLFYFYQMSGVLFGQSSLVDALNNLIMQFSPVFVIYLAILYNIHFQQSSKENDNEA